MSLALAEGVMFAAARLTKQSPETIRSRSRLRRISRVRQAMCWVIRTRSDWSTPQIARYLNMRDHTDVLYACRQIPKYVETCAFTAQLVEKLLAAEPVPPLMLDDLLAGEDFNGNLVKTKRSIERYVEDGRVRTRRKMVPLEPLTVPPPTPRVRGKRRRSGEKWEKVEVDGHKSIFLNDLGEDRAQCEDRKRLVQGSRLLAEALNRCREEHAA